MFVPKVLIGVFPGWDNLEGQDWVWESSQKIRTGWMIKVYGQVWIRWVKSERQAFKNISQIRIDNTGLFELKTTASQDKSKHVLDWSDLIYGNFGLNESVLTSKPRYSMISQVRWTSLDIIDDSNLIVKTSWLYHVGRTIPVELSQR